jgi:SAM-dependent methyltransferase
MQRRKCALTVSPHILEIGAGYGGLAHHLSKIIKGKSVYVIVDLPETLLYAAAYLTLHNPDKKLYLYEKGCDIDGSCDFILIPHYRLDLLQYWKFDLVINVASMQEMRTDQVETYLNFINQTSIGLLYSLNVDCYIQNTELTCLSDLLKARFDIVEVSGRNVWDIKYKTPKPTRVVLLECLGAIARKLLFLPVPPVVAPVIPDMRFTLEKEYFCRVKGWQSDKNVTGGLRE